MNRSMQAKMLKAKREMSKTIKEASQRESMLYGSGHIPTVFLSKPYSVTGSCKCVQNYRKPATVAV